jgi:hypothetical protein
MSRFWTPKPHFRGGRACFRRKMLGTLWLLCALLLPGCGESPPRGYAGSTTSDTLQPITAPPGSKESPPLPGTTGAPKTADGLPALSAKGVNTALFTQEVKDEVARMERLENAVQELRNDFDAMSPAIVRLVAIEKDIQNLISQLEVLTGNEPPPPVEPIDSAMLEDIEPVQPAPVPLPAALAETTASNAPAQLQPQQLPSAQETAAAPVSGPPAPEQAPPPPIAQSPPQEAVPAAATAAPVPLQPAANNGPAVTAMRVGEHPGKLRIVLDVRGKTSYTADLDNNEKILVVELPKTAWTAESQKSFSGNPLLSSYRTEAMADGGTMLILQLKSASSIGYKAAIDNPDGGSRIVIDLTLP